MKFNRTLKLTVALLTMVIVHFSALAQESSGNVFSPYSFYGLGVMDGQGSAAIQSMSGTSIATKNPFTANTANPAAYSVAPTQTMLFSFGLRGNNEYLKSSTGKTSNNTFTLSDVSAQFPIAKNMGFGFSYSPYTSVGYKMSFNDKSPDLITDIGSITYNYTGNGGVALIKAGFGMEAFKGFSIGANMLYYFGDITRTSFVTFYPIVSQDKTYRSTYSSNDSYISKIGGEIGAQYDVDLRHDRFLTLGFVYTPKLNTGVKDTRYYYSSSDNITDSVYLDTKNTKLIIPNKFSAGIAYRSTKLTLAADYIYQNWGGAFDINTTDNIRLTTTQEFRLGFEYTPNRFDLRSPMKRWTYRAGLRTSDFYMLRNNHKVREYSGSFGVGVPLQRGGGSMLNIGFEAGSRGSLKQGLIKETYFKVNLGVTLFTTKEWFIRHRFK